MPVTTLNVSAAYYGNSKYSSFSETATNHLYVGYTGGTSFNYRSLLKFPSLKSIAAIGTNAITVSKVQLFCYRTDGGATTVTIGPSSSTSWNASLVGTNNGERWAASTTWKSATITNASALAAIRDYSGAWYMHMRGDSGGAYMRLASTGTSYKPYLQVTWEYDKKTVTFTDGTNPIDSIVCDGTNTVTINIDSSQYASDASYTLTWSIGDQNGTVVANLARTGDTTTTTWTPSADLLTEIPTSVSGQVSLTLTAYNSGGGVFRTEKAVFSISVPDSVIAGRPYQAITALNGYKLYGLQNMSSLDILPALKADGLYGATIEEIKATVFQTGSDNQEIVWSKNEIGDDLNPTWFQGHYDTSGNFLTPETWADSQDTYLPITSCFIPVIPEAKIIIQTTFPAANSSRWFGAARYNASGTWIGRTALSITASGSTYTATYTPGANDAYVRLITRTFGNGVTTVRYNDDSIVCGSVKTTSILTQSGTATVSIEVADSRGRNADMTSYVASTATILPYHAPLITEFDIDRIAPAINENDQIEGYEQADDGSFAWANLMVELQSIKPSSSEEQTLSFLMTVTNGSDGTFVGSRSGTLALTSGETLTAQLENELASIFPTSIQETDSNNDTVTRFNTANIYQFEITVTDIAGVSTTAYSQIAPGRANMHLAGSKYGVAFGRFSKGTDPSVQADPGPLFECEYPAIFYNGIDVRGGQWISLELNTTDGVGDGNSGYVNPGMQYRVENGNHVYVHANINTNGQKTINPTLNPPVNLVLNSEALPYDIRPSGQVHTVGCCNGWTHIVKAFINTDGYALIYSIQNIVSSSANTSFEFLWTDLTWDWFI